MLAHARRCTLFALVASLLALTAVAPASAQEPDRDGDGYPDSADACPDQPYNAYPGGSNGCPGPAGPNPYAPDADLDGDGVINAQDKCPSDGVRGQVDANGCPPPPDKDGDGYPDSTDSCPNEPTNEYSSSMYGAGCPGRAPFNEPDTPPASGPSCTKKMPCMVLERRGLSEKMNGGYFDDNATVKVTIARDAQGNPARVVEVELKNLNSTCTDYDEKTRQYSTRPGPEVSATLDSPLALKKSRQRHGGGGFSTVYRFDPMRSVRTIKGLKYHVLFSMYEDGEGLAEFSANAVGFGSGDCTINIYGNNDPVTDGVCTGNVQEDERGTCGVAENQDIDDIYKRGQALHFDCGASFKCPDAKDVDVKLTVIKSVAKALGLKSTTISGKAVGPTRTKLDGEKGTYYFVRLDADVVRKMKAKGVREITVTVSGNASGPDGVRRFSPTRVEWFYDGNCSGRDVKFKKHLTYGGTCRGR